MAFHLTTGIFQIGIAIYLFLLLRGHLPRSPRNPEKLKEWREQFGGIVKVLSPLLLMFGIFSIVMAFL